jgi:uncharacterized protein (DUF302 family)
MVVVMIAMLLAYGSVAVAGHRVMKMSKYKFQETVDKIKAAIQAEGFKVVSVIDHQATLSEAGVTKPPWVLIEFFSPKYTKEVLTAETSADLDIPLRISVMDGDPNDPHGGAPHASYYKPSVLLADYKKLAKVGKELDGALERIVKTIEAKH